MRKVYLVVAVITLIAGLLVFSVKLRNGQKGAAVASQEAAKSAPPAGGHAGHGGAPPPPPQQTAPAQDKQGESQEPPTVEVPEDKQKLMGVKVADVSVRPLYKAIRTVGRIEYDERRLSTVNTKFEGWIERLFVDYTGRYVKKGEPLAEIYSPELYATQQEYLNAIKWSKQKLRDSQIPVNSMMNKDAITLAEGARRRLRLWDISDEQLKKIEETGEVMRTLTLYSPANGYVIQKMALRGMRVMPGEKLFDVADLSSLWIIADIYENELSMIKPGETARISMSYFPDRELTSKIDYVYPTLSGDTRTAKVRFSIPNMDGKLKPQMFTNVEVKINIGKKLSVPNEAILDTGTRQIVYVDKGDGYFEPREVKLGAQGEGYREVLMGLKSGEKVAAAATFLIDSEAQLKNVTPIGGHQHK